MNRKPQLSKLVGSTLKKSSFEIQFMLVVVTKLERFSFIVNFSASLRASFLSLNLSMCTLNSGALSFTSWLMWARYPFLNRLLATCLAFVSVL